ncbi:Xaa-Pro dipeptidase [Halioxenophilus aromaticivorans]|uniref:Xaa-Pro dipeptidase n=1 Tax=Halioxenophilus aromaticivorans TaxID=1306992 RepID=A0AAV3U2T3_9ALTE
MIPTDLQQAYNEHCQIRLTQYQAAMQAAGRQWLIVDSGGLQTRFLDDTTYPFRLNPYSARLAPLQSFPESLMIIGHGEQPALLLYQPEDYWHAVAGLDCPAIEQRFTVKTFSQIERLLQEAKAITGGQAVAYLGERPQRFDHAQPNPTLLLAYLDFQQAVKTGYEITCIRRANQIAAKGHQAVAETCRTTTSELALHLKYLEAIDASDDTLPYDNIIAGNQHAAILHYTLRNDEPQSMNSLLIDAGATYLGYCSDISRTYGNQPGLFADLIAQLDTLQTALCDSIKPGVVYTEYHHQASLGIAELLVDNNIITCSKSQAKEQQLAGVFFPHGLGHLLGVQVHDRGGHQADTRGTPNPPPEKYPHLRFTRTLATDQVFTIEPGIYFIDQLLKKAHSDGRGKHFNWALIETLKPFGGIRIEDNVRVTEQGSENLTRPAF